MKLHKLGLIAALAVGSLLFFTSVSSAQENKDATKKKGGMSVEQRMERLTTELTLTDAQKPKVKAVLEDSQKKMTELRNDTALDQPQRREKFQALREEELKKMKAILTPEQYTKYEAMPQGRKGGGKKKAE